MLRSEVQNLGWIPPSRRLHDTLQRADDLAREHNHRELMLEHVVLGLTDDTDAARVLEANGVVVPRFRDYVARYVAAVDYRWPPHEPGLPVPDDILKRIFDVASAAAESSGRGEVDGALIVAAIIGEGTSNAAAMLNLHGLNVDEDDHEDVSVQETPRTSTAQPSLAAPTTDLSEVHRMLAAPAESVESSGRADASAAAVQPTGSAQTPVSSNVSPTSMRPAPTQVLPALQRTRPKEKSPRPAQPLPKAIVGQNGSHATAIPARPVAPNGSGIPQPVSPVQTPPQSPVGTTTQRPDHVSPPATEAPATNGEDRLDSNTQPPVIEGLAQIDANILADILPAKMRLGAPEVIEIRVLNSDIDLLTGQFEGRDVVQAGTKLVSRSLCLRLRSPSGSFVIENRSPEVQWITSDDIIVGDETTSWRWQVTGQRRGTGRLQLQASARTVSSDGTVLETAMPDQAAELRITRGVGTVLKRFLLFLALFVAGCAVGAVARPLYRMIETVLLG